MKKIILFSAVFLFHVSFCYAQQSKTANPGDYFMTQIQILSDIIADPDLDNQKRQAEFQRQVLAFYDEHFNWEESSKKALMYHWFELTPNQRSEFVDVFKILLQDIYVSGSKTYQGRQIESIDEKIKLLRDEIDGEYARSYLYFITNNGQKIEVIVHLVDDNGQWKAYDLSIAGVSLISNYQAQFESVIQRESFEKLLERLTQKANKLIEDKGY